MISEKAKYLLAENIKRFRKERGLSQEDLGCKVGLSGVAIMRYEKGQRAAKLETIEAIATALNVTGFDLLGFEYLDLKNPDMGKKIKEMDGFEAYLKSLDYAIESIPEGNNEEGITSITYTISGNGITATLTDEEYQQLQSSSGDLIFSFLWKKQK